MMIFHKNLRKIAEIIKNFVAKILKICPKKMYTLNRYGGNKLEQRGIRCLLRGTLFAAEPCEDCSQHLFNVAWSSDPSCLLLAFKVSAL